MSLFKIEYKKLVVLLLPIVLRQPRIIAFMQAAVAGISDLQYRFCRSREERIKRIHYNGQVCVLEGLLNDEADPTSRRIKISDAVAVGTWKYVYAESGTYHEVVAPCEIGSEGLLTDGTSYFTVSVPWAYGQNNDVETRVKWLLNEYKLASKKYIIKYE